MNEPVEKISVRDVYLALSELPESYKLFPFYQLKLCLFGKENPVLIVAYKDMKPMSYDFQVPILERKWRLFDFEKTV